MLNDKENDIVTLEAITVNEPVKIEVPGVGYIRYRMPTGGQERDAVKEAKASKLWKTLSILEQSDEIARRLTLKMMVEPKLTYEEYLKNPSLKIGAILDTVFADRGIKIMKLKKKRLGIMSTFLDLAKELSQETSIGSSKNKITTGRKLQVPTTT